MRIAIVAATVGEIEPLLRFAALSRETSTHAGRETPLNRFALMSVAAPHTVDVFVTGVGMVATAGHTAWALAHARYGLALNLGLCGSFNRAVALGSVVHVTSDCLAELGAEDTDAFMTIEDLRLPGQSRFMNAKPPANAILSALPEVRGITVNTVHGRDNSIDDAVARFAPQVESMEGAAFMSACLVAGVPFAQVRGVSNFVERRNPANWQVAKAIANLGRCALALIRQP